MAPSDFQALFDLVVVFENGDHKDGNRLEYGRGEKIPAKVLGDADRDRYLEIGAIRAYSDAALPSSSNPDAELAGALTQPDGSPVTLAPDEAVDSGFKAARTHAEADAMAADYGVTFPEKTKLDEKNAALEQMATARAAGETSAPAATEENLAELSDEELVQRGIDYGHTEEEMAELGHDALVLFVAEAMARQGATTAQQEASVSQRQAAETAAPSPATE